MSRSYRCVFIAAVGWLSLIGASPEGRIKAESDQTAAEEATGNQLQRIATALEKSPQSPKPDAGCQAGKDDRGSDLCAQWKAADAASEAAWWAGATFYSTLFGLVLGSATLAAAGFAAWYAKRAAEATEGQLRHTELVTAAQLRPYVYFEDTENAHNEPLDFSPTGRLVVMLKNFGQVPANNVEVFRGADTVSRPIGDFQVDLAPSDSVGSFGPGAKQSVTINFFDMSEEIANDVRSGKSVLLIRLRVEYDISDTERVAHDVTSFIDKRVIDSKISGGLMLTPEQRRQT